MWYIYVAQSLKDGYFYTGISEDPNKRLGQHNSGMTRSTKSRRPFKLVYQEECENRIKAREKEKYFKSGIGREFLKQKTRPHNSMAE